MVFILQNLLSPSIYFSGALISKLDCLQVLAQNTQYWLSYLETLQENPFYFWADEATDFSALLPGGSGPVTVQFLNNARFVVRSHVIRVTPITFFIENLTTPVLMRSMSIPDHLTTTTSTTPDTPISTVAVGDVDCLTEHDEEEVFITHCQTLKLDWAWLAKWDFQVNK